MVKPFSARSCWRVNPPGNRASSREVAALETKLRLDTERLAAIVACSFGRCDYYKNLDVLSPPGTKARNAYSVHAEEAIGQPITLIIAGSPE
jgi:hypothetical protein